MTESRCHVFTAQDNSSSIRSETLEDFGARHQIFSILARDLVQMVERIVIEADALVAELAEHGIKHPILSAIRKVISNRAGSLQRVTEQVP